MLNTYIHVCPRLGVHSSEWFTFRWTGAVVSQLVRKKMYFQTIYCMPPGLLGSFALGLLPYCASPKDGRESAQRDYCINKLKMEI